VESWGEVGGGGTGRLGQGKGEWAGGSLLLSVLFLGSSPSSTYLPPPPSRSLSSSPFNTATTAGPFAASAVSIFLESPPCGRSDRVYVGGKRSRTVECRRYIASPLRNARPPCGGRIHRGLRTHIRHLPNGVRFFGALYSRPGVHQWRRGGSVWMGFDDVWNRCNGEVAFQAFADLPFR